jgi:hypothetical protein
MIVEPVIYVILSKLQKELKVPKGQTNSYSGYKFRNCEDILEAVKKILPEGISLILNDEIIQVGDRHYIKATATLCDAVSRVSASALAREPLSKKGFDESQITGAASSYARKYALSGLFLIDDSRDADSRDNRNSEQNEESRPNLALHNEFHTLMLKHNVSSDQKLGWCKWANVTAIQDLSDMQMSALIAKMKQKELNDEII